MNAITNISKRKLNSYLKFLSENKYGHYELPEEYRGCLEIVLKERELKVRKVLQCGYDVIKQQYFVKEELKYDRHIECIEEIQTTFKNFDEYYNYLDGKIYKNACYYQCDFEGATIEIDKKKLLRKKSLISKKICDDIPEGTISVDEKFKQRELLKDVYKSFIEQIRNCQSYEELIEIEKAYNERFANQEYEYASWGVIFSFIFKDDMSSLKKRRMIKEYVKGLYLPGCGDDLSSECEYNPLSQYCTLVSTTNIIGGYFYRTNELSKSVRCKYRKRLKRLLEVIESGYEIKYQYGFDNITHFYYEEKIYYSSKYKMNLCSQFQFFDTFDEFIKYRKNDLSDCDLKYAIDLNVDWNKYVVNENTMLPKSYSEKIEYSVTKWASRDEYFVCQEWKNEREILAKEENRFSYFFDFVFFLNYDLSGANLALIDGLINLKEITEYKLDNAILRSDFCDKFDIPYEIANFKEPKINHYSFDNEKNIVLQQRMPVDAISEEYTYNQQKIYYISDLHLMHRIVNAGCKTVNDAKAYLCNLAFDIVDSMEALEKPFLLIGGDICSDYFYYTFFIEQLKRKYANIVIILGNHEFYNFPLTIGERRINTYNDILDTYRNLIGNKNVFFLQNDILYMDVDSEMHIIRENELLRLSEEEIKDKTKDARYIFFGGLGFAGCNESFNAKNGIYINDINSTVIIERKQEIEESKKFDFLYKKIVSALRKKTLIIMTHMPKKDWSNEEYESNVIHISGHNHRNYYYDDGEIRVYADNQIGYKNEKIHLKYLCVEKECDVFAHFEDGIYEINREEYIKFMRGKNIRMNFNREYYKIYMLKRNDVYMFVLQLREDGDLMLLNGGAIRSLGDNNIQYFYDHMAEQINYIKTPLDKFTEYQTHIANEIRQIGGIGRIHGCIIDIDFYNHIYVNPIDMKLTGYYATDIINKTVYSTIPELLKDKCPQIYENYLGLIGQGKNTLVISSKKNEVALRKQMYLETDIYRASLDIKKMQRLQSNILSVWYEYIEKSLKRKKHSIITNSNCNKKEK